MALFKFHNQFKGSEDVESVIETMTHCNYDTRIKITKKKEMKFQIKPLIHHN